MSKLFQFSKENNHFFVIYTLPGHKEKEKQLSSFSKADHHTKNQHLTKITPKKWKLTRKKESSSETKKCQTNSNKYIYRQG